MTENEWKIYHGSAEQSESASIDRWLETLPPWRRLAKPSRSVSRELPHDEVAERRGRTYVSSGTDEVLRVNIALMLRRPLLITGPAGVGKSSLAYNIAWCLGLGGPLRWEINSRTTLQDGLYSYDAVGHLHASQSQKSDVTIGDFLTLGPLGTALLPTTRPRVLLIDEIDKAGFDLPNDLLHVFEEGSFTIPELVRLGGDQEVYPFDSRSREDRVPVSEGRVSTTHHPVVAITSNGERYFSPAFVRRCVPLDLGRPDEDRLRKIVLAQLGSEVLPETLHGALDRFPGQTTDVLLQAIFLKQRYGIALEQADLALRRED